MIKSLTLGLASAALAFGLTGCSLKTSAPQNHNMNLHEIDMKKVSQMKKGTACHSRFLMFIPVGTDDTLLSAASNGDISKIVYVEKHASGIPFIYNEFCTDVYGE